MDGENKERRRKERKKRERLEMEERREGFRGEPEENVPLGDRRPELRGSVRRYLSYGTNTAYRLAAQLEYSDQATLGSCKKDRTRNTMAIPPSWLLRLSVSPGANSVRDPTILALPQWR